MLIYDCTEMEKRHNNDLALEAANANILTQVMPNSEYS